MEWSIGKNPAQPLLISTRDKIGKREQQREEDKWKKRLNKTGSEENRKRQECKRKSKSKNKESEW